MRTLYLFVVGALLSIAVAETTLHAIERSPLWRILPVVERELGWPDPDLGYRLRANHSIINVREQRAKATTNSHGMRDKERELLNKRHAFRVAVMGNSITEALQVADQSTFTRVAERTLNAGSGAARYEVLNFALSGAGPLQQLLQYQHEAARFSPDLAVFVVNIVDFINQELSNDHLGPAYVDNGNGTLVMGTAFRQRSSQRYQHHIVGNIFFGLMDHSRLARAGYLRLKVGELADNREGGAAAQLDCKKLGRTIAGFTTLWADNQPAGAAARLSRYLNDAARTHRQTETPFQIALYGVPAVPETCAAIRLKRTALMATIARRLEEHDIGFVDLERAVQVVHREQYANRGLHGFGVHTGSGHLNDVGHRAFAAAFVKLITDRRILPRPAGNAS